ncbi:MAG: metal ABC transporter substrate-binding protein [Clostridiales bacterium]|nr:metal ABC transporter substrate-binding protein [Clostridiales bacterium]
MKKRLLAGLMALVLLAVGGCAAAEDDKEVVASFYPVYVLLQNVTAGVEGVSVRCLTAPSTGCLHDYQLLTQDMRALETACVFVINGAGMESFLPVVAEGFPDLPVVDSSEGIDLLANEPGAETPYNAHIWLAPENAARMVENMVAGLSEAMPEHAEAFAANGAACVARLKALDEELRAGLENLSRRDIVTFHEAFSYFAKAYGLNVVAVVALEPDEGISPRMLTELVDKVVQAGNPPLFTEPQYESNAALAVQQETGAPVYELDPLVTGDGAPDAYEAGMRKNLQVLREALGAAD